MTIDRIFLGNFSTEALGAAMAVMGVFWVPMALLQGTAQYVTTFVAQYTGAHEDSKIGACLWQAIYVSVLGGTAFLFLNFESEWFYRLVGHAQNVQVLEIEYFNAMAFSALPIALVAAVSGFFTGLGQTKKVIGINFTGLFFNVLLGYVMIFGNWGFPRMGVTGAGYATAIATYIAAAYGLILVFNEKNEKRFRVFSDWRLDFSLLKQFLKYGLPSGAQWAFEGVAFTVFLILMGQTKNGEAALAGSSIAVTVMMLSVLPSMGVAQAVMTLVGQRLGEKLPERAAVTTWDGVKISSIYMGCVALSFFLVPEFYLSWFHNEENPGLWGEVSALVPILLKTVAVFTVMDSMYLNISFALKGAGDTRFVSVVALLVPWPFMVLPAFLVRGWNDAVLWAWAFVAAYSFVVTGILVARFRRGKWRGMSVIGVSA